MGRYKADAFAQRRVKSMNLLLHEKGVIKDNGDLCKPQILKGSCAFVRLGEAQEYNFSHHSGAMIRKNKCIELIMSYCY